MTTKQMAYGNIELGMSSDTHRVARTVPFMRRGINLPVMPQFKGLWLYTLAAGPTTQNVHVPIVFRQLMTPNRVRWPVGPGGQVTTPASNQE